MDIDKKILDKWEKLHTKDDYKAIVASMKPENKVSIEHVRVCAKTGVFKNLKVYKAVAEYYNKKEKQLDKINKLTR